MGWLRSVGSLKYEVVFAKEPYKRDDILQKRRTIFRSLLIVATPYTVPHCNTYMLCYHRIYATHTRPHCNTLQHTATHCNTLQHTDILCNHRIYATHTHFQPSRAVPSRTQARVPSRGACPVAGPHSCWAVRCVTGCCRVLQGAVVCYRVLPGVVGCCRLLQCATGCCHVLRGCCSASLGCQVWCGVLQGVAGCCWALQGFSGCCRVSFSLGCHVRCSVL